jgi:predicted ATPase
LAKIFRGWALVQEGHTESGLPLIERSLAEHRATGELLEVPYCISLLAECLVQTGRNDLALKALDDALALTKETQEAWFEPELNRLRGEVLLTAGTAGAALECLHRARDQAKQQGARMWECRAAQSLARALAASGKPEEARTLLAPLREQFAGIVSTAELLAVDQMLALLPKRNRRKAARGNG